MNIPWYGWLIYGGCSTLILIPVIGTAVEEDTRGFGMALAALVFIVLIVGIGIAMAQ